MTNRALSEGLAALGDRFYVLVSPEVRRTYAALHGDLPDAVWFQAVERARDWFEFPSAQKFFRFVPPPAWSKGQHGLADPDHAHAASELIQAIASGNCRGATREACFREMEKRYPNCGWAEAADAVMRDAEREPRR